MNELVLFAGAGGGILGGVLSGNTIRAAVEIDKFCRSVLLQRQRDGALPRFPIWDDIRTFDGVPWRGKIDIIKGGFPCQDISAAGKGAGLAGSRSGLVFEMLRIVDEVRPRYVVAENSPNLRTRGLGTILKEFASMGYDARWGVLGAWHVGAPHRRNRMWILATNTNGAKLRLESGRCSGEDRQEKTQPTIAGKKRYVADATSERLEEPLLERIKEGERDATNHRRWDTEPDVGRVADGVAHRVDRLKAIGNGAVPAVAKTAWEILR